MYRLKEGSAEVLLIHPGGPYWTKKDDGAWSIPKGEIEEGEDPIRAAKREFEEETGLSPEGTFRPLRPVRLKSGKIVYAWAFEGDWDARALKSLNFTMEWPPRSGKAQEFPEADRADWFDLKSCQGEDPGRTAGVSRRVRAHGPVKSERGDGLLAFPCRLPLLA